MSGTLRTGYEALPPDLAELLDRACDQFEATWKTGGRPALEDYLAAVPEPERPTLLRELILIDAAYRLGAGEAPRPEDYGGRFPEVDGAWLARQLPAVSPDGPTTTGLPTRTGSPSVFTVPGYEIRRELGRGGMGVVYEARQQSLGRVVALKVLRDQALADPEQIARFHVEAEAAARLQHPNIIQIHEIGTHQGRPYLALEYVAGGSLARFLAGTPQPPRQAAQCLETLARAAHVAHQHGIVHRDLKPANILLHGGEREKAKGERKELPVPGSSSPCTFPLFPFASPKITDFGLAKRLDVDGSLTSTGAVLGTPCYMAPEQTGDPAAAGRTVGPAADVYALGAILYEMLTGRPPFQGETVVETLLQVREHDPVPPSRLRPQMPRDLETITLKCLRKEPARRYASAAELADDLRRFLDARPIRARPVGVGERLVKWVRRRPAVAALVAVSSLTLLLLVAGLAAGVLVLAERERHTRRILDLERENKASLEKAYYYNRNSLALDWWNHFDVPRAEQLLDECPVYLRRWEWHYLKRLCHAELVHRAAPGAAGATVLSPDGRRFAWAGSDGAIHLVEIASGAGRELARVAHPVRALAFDVLGKYLAAGDGANVIHVWDTGSGQGIGRLQDLVRPLTALAFHPDGGRLALGAADGSVSLWERATGQVIEMPKRHGGAVRAVAFRPDGRQLASAGEDGVVRLWDVASRREFRPIPHPDDRPALCLAYSADGRRLATGWTSGKVWLHQPDLNPRKSDLGIALSEHAQAVTSVAYGPDGRFLASGSAERTVRLWSTANQQMLRVYRGLTGAAVSAAFEPEGGRLAAATAAGVVKVWDGTQNQQSLTLEHPPGPRPPAVKPDEVPYLAFSPDGRALASVTLRLKGRPPTLRMWDTVTGALRWEQADRDGPVSFSPDGALLAAGAGDGAVVFLESQRGEKINRRVAVHQRPVSGLEFNPTADPPLVASAAWQEIAVWDPLEGECFHLTQPGRTLAGPTHSRDGRRLAYADDGGNLWVVEAATGASVFRHAEPGARFWALAFSPDGRFLAAAVLQTWTVKVWDLADGKEVCTLGGHTDKVKAVAFSPDGERLATASFDRSVKIWDWRTEKEVLTLRGHQGRVLAVAFSPDGHRLASAAADGTVRVWDATPLSGAAGR